MNKLAQIHMLPTQLISKLGVNARINHLYYTEHNAVYNEGQHLYFTTDEEIKEGDHALNVMTKSVGSVIKVINMGGGINDITIKTHEEDITSSSNNFRKIVATTNPDLWEFMGDFDYYKHTLGKIGLDFVEAYVKAQGSIKEVMLEYFDRYDGAHSDNIKMIVISHNEIKLRSNGTVIIHLIKEVLYTRQEMLVNCFKAFNHQIELLPYDTTSFKEWKREYFDKRYPKV